MNKKILLMISLLSAHAGVFARTPASSPEKETAAAVTQDMDDILLYTEKDMQKATDEAYKRGKADGMLEQLNADENEDDATTDEEGNADEQADGLDSLMDDPEIMNLADNPEELEKMLQQHPEKMEQIMQSPEFQKMMQDPEMLQLLAEAEKNGDLGVEEEPNMAENKSPLANKQILK